MADAPERISVTITTGPATCEWVEYIRADIAQPPENVIDAISAIVDEMDLINGEAQSTFNAGMFAKMCEIRTWLDSLRDTE